MESKMVKQGTNEWLIQRLGKCTASRVFDIIPGKRGNYLAPREKYLYELLTERLTGVPTEFYITPAMQWGMDTEGLARSVYEAKLGVIVHEVGFVDHATIPMFGASADGIIADGRGTCEIKCPTQAVHAKVLATGYIDPKYYYQMQTVMLMAGREYCDYINYDPRFPEEFAMYINRIERDQEAIEQIEHESILFLAELKKLEEKIRGNK